MQHHNTIKAIIYISTPLLLLACSACTKNALEPRYDDPSTDIRVEDPDEPLPSVNEELAEVAWEKRLIYQVGPVNLPAHTEAIAQLDAPLTLRFQADEYLWVTGFIPKVVDESGAELPSSLLHQALLINLHEENPYCAEAQAGNPIFIATSLLSEIQFPYGYGYPLLPTDPLEATVVLQNPTDESYTGVSFKLVLITRPMNEFTNLADVKPILLEADPCDHTPLQIEPESFVKRDLTYPSPHDMRILLMQGALQNYGAAVELSAGDDAEPFWRAQAKCDERHDLVDLVDSPFIEPSGIPVDSGDQLTLGITYDNTSSAWLPAATAAAMIYILPME